MEKITAFKCGFCGKLYENTKSCQNHERRCYFNLRNRSCAACAFNKVELKEYKPGHLVQFPTCMVNINIPQNGLQTKCSKFLARKYEEDKEIMRTVAMAYDFKPQLISYLTKFKIISI